MTNVFNRKIQNEMFNHFITADNHTRRSDNIIQKRNIYISVIFMNVKYTNICLNHLPKMLYEIKTISTQ